MFNVFRPHFGLAEVPSPHIYLHETVESLTRDVHIKPIHSHNDYWRKRPLLDALLFGCASVEGDIWRFPDNYTVTDTESTVEFSTNEIYVGHNQVYLKPEDTLNEVYLDPIYRFLEAANKQFSHPMIESFGSKFGVFYDAPEAPLYFWLDLKTEGNATYTALKPYIERFIAKGYLASYDAVESKYTAGPVAITLTGYVPWALLGEEEHRYVFADCPLQNFTKNASKSELDKYASSCIFASASLEQLLGDKYSQAVRGEFTEENKETLRAYFDLAHEYGIKTRIWGGVDWPMFVRDAHWKSLWELGCDLINADDLAAAANEF